MQLLLLEMVGVFQLNLWCRTNGSGHHLLKLFVTENSFFSHDWSFSHAKKSKDKMTGPAITKMWTLFLSCSCSYRCVRLDFLKLISWFCRLKCTFGTVMTLYCSFLHHLERTLFLKSGIKIYVHWSSWSWLLFLSHVLDFFHCKKSFIASEKQQSNTTSLPNIIKDLLLFLGANLCFLFSWIEIFFF